MAKKINSKQRFWSYLKDPLKKNMLFEIVFYGVVWGPIINFALTIFGLPFTPYFSSYGIFLYVFKSQIIRIWRNLFFKYENIGEQYT